MFTSGRAPSILLSCLKPVRRFQIFPSVKKQQSGEKQHLITCYMPGTLVSPFLCIFLTPHNSSCSTYYFPICSHGNIESENNFSIPRVTSHSVMELRLKFKFDLKVLCLLSQYIQLY